MIAVVSSDCRTSSRVRAGTSEMLDWRGEEYREPILALAMSWRG